MKLLSKKKIAITAFTLAALGLLTLVGVLVAVGTTHGPKVTISADDLAEMKTLVHKYLNERSRVIVSPDPQNDSKVAGAPVIDPSEMSPELAARQKEDVEKLRARGHTGTSDDFTTFTRVLDIREKGDDVVLDIVDTTFYHSIIPGAETDPSIRYIVEGGRRYYTFAHQGNRWILTDAKLDSGADPPFNEPSVAESYGKRSSRVLANPPKEITKIPEKIKRLDEAATEKITNKWAIDDKTMEAIMTEMGEEKNIPYY